MLEAVSIVRYMHKVSTLPNHETFETLLQGAYKDKSVQVAEEFVMSRMRQNISSVSSKCIGFAFLTFASVGAVKLFQKLHSMVLEQKIQHDKYSMAGLLHACVILERFTWHKDASEETDIILDNDILHAIEILEPLGIAKSTLDNIEWDKFCFTRSGNITDYSQHTLINPFLIPSIPECCSKLVTAFCRKLETEKALEITEIMKAQEWFC